MDKPELTSKLSDRLRTIPAGYSIGPDKRASLLLEIIVSFVDAAAEESACNEILDAIMSSCQPDDFDPELMKAIECLFNNGADPLYNTKTLLKPETSHLDDDGVGGKNGPLSYAPTVSLNPLVKRDGVPSASPFALALETGNDTLIHLFVTAIKKTPRKPCHKRNN